MEHITLYYRQGSSDKVYQASIERRPVDPRTITGSVSPPWWPPDLSNYFNDIKEYGTR